ncbi:sodium:neurotransmitter symporter family protein [Trichinella spiralis]|uniref:sodium:neurotransmitter symporter family protein n=1 Tax=Trichinella spiralis TaxID=6334 RepID=UPI0001EFD51B|nr:sodium:neurotransmitter symporter family protein [Trichinella spiralis]
MSSAFIIEEWRDLWSYKGDFVITCFAYVFSQSSLLSLPKCIRNCLFGFFAILLSAVDYDGTEHWSTVCQRSAEIAVQHMPLACRFSANKFALYLAQVLTRIRPIRKWPYDDIFEKLKISLFLSTTVFKFAVDTLTNGRKLQRSIVLLISNDVLSVGSAFILYSLVISSLLASYVSYILSFLVHLFTNIEEANPPWALCSSEWSTVPCVDNLAINNSGQTSLNNVKEFFDLSVLNVTTRIEESGDLQWMLISGIAGTWLLVCYFTFIIPLLLLLTLLVKSLSSNGANHLLQDVFETDWNALLKVETWVQAFAQSLYGTGLCFGAYITLGSFNKRNNNVFGDGLLIIVIHTALSALGFVTLSAMLGIFKSKFSIPSSVVLTDGNNAHVHKNFYHSRFSQILNLLASASHFDQPQLWSTLYILMLNVQTSIEDAIGDSASKFFPRFGISFATCCIGFVASLGYASQAGFYASQLMMKFIDLLCPWTLLAFELFAVAWLYCTCAHLLARDTSLYYCYQNVELQFSRHFERQSSQPLDGISWMVCEYGNIVTDHYRYAVLHSENLHTRPRIYPLGGNCYLFTVETKFKYTILSPIRYEVPKVVSVPRYSSTAPGYVLLPHAPLAEPEQFNDIYSDRQQTRVSKI